MSCALLVRGVFVLLSLCTTSRALHGAAAQDSQAVVDARARLAEPEPEAAKRWEWVLAVRGAANALGSSDEEFELSIALHRRALDVVRTMKYPDGEAELAYRLASSLGKHGRTREARELLEETLVRAPSPTYEPYLRAELVQLARRDGELERAESALAELDACIARAPGNADALRVQAAIERIDLRLRLGQIDRAIEASSGLVEVETRLAAAGALDPLDWQNIRRKRWDVLLAAQDFRGVLAEIDRARVDGAAALAVVGDGELRFYRALALASLALGEGRGEPEATAALVEVAAESARNPLDRVHLRHALAWLAVEHGRFGDAARELDLAHELLETRVVPVPALERAQEAALRAALALARGDDTASLARLCDASEPHWRALFDEWGRVPVGKSGWGSLHFATHRGVLAQWMRLAERADPERGAERAFDALVRAQAQGSLARSLGASSPTLADIRRELLVGDDHGVVVIVPSLDRTYVWTVDRAGVRSFAAPGVLRVEPALDRLRELASRKLTPEERAQVAGLGREVARGLLTDDACAVLARWRRLSVVGGEFFGWLPVESFVVDASGRALGLTHAIDHWPSIPVASALAARLRAQPAGASELACVALASPTIAESSRERWKELVPLPFDDDERAMLLGELDGARSRVLTGAAADSAGLVEALAAGPRVLALVAHGVQVGELERPAAIALASGGADDDGLLACDEVESLRAPAVVELAVCGSMRGPARCGDDGPSHLAGAFLRAGSSAVLASRADLEYRASLRLIGAFHSALSDGATVAEALRRAREHVAGLDEKHTAPWYHGAVQVFGYGHLAVLEPRPRRTPLAAWLGAGGLLVVGVAFVALRRRSERSQRAHGPVGGVGGGGTGGIGRSV
ncbi:MAG: CHAT domain-containing protein [Planctomycetes bacterium]|nr:CHAT domain-containing protein [Planctomycetota bacterium]